MLRPFYQISIQQVTQYSYTDNDGVVNIVPRKKLITLDFVTSYEIDNGWESHTNNCKITFPKNISLKDGNFLFQESGTFNAILGGSVNQDINGNIIKLSPLLMKGDIVYISDGYWYRNQLGKDIQVGSNVFFGYISNVHSDTPIVIDCEDNFYLLKRTPFDKTKWTGNLYSLMNHIIDLVNTQFSNNDKYKINGVNPYPKLNFFEVPNSITAEFTLGYLDIGDITCGQLLDKLKQQYHFESTFTENTLQFGVTIYNDQIGTFGAAKSNTFFAFEDIYENKTLKTSANIFTHDLEYSNKQDVVLSTVVQCKIAKKTGRTTKDGKDVTKKQKMKILVFWDIPTETFKYTDLSKPGSVTPHNSDGGERHNCWYPVNISEPAPKISDLFELGKQQLNKYYYTGFKGSFKTFGFPYVTWNDNVNLVSVIFPDRNGQYKIKRVKRSGGIHGLSQEIHVDYLQQDVLLGKLTVRQIPKNTKSIYMI